MNEELQRITQSAIDERSKWLATAIKAQTLASFLPEEVQNLKIRSVDLSYDGKFLQVNIYGKEAYQILKELGVEGFTPHYASWDDMWYLTDGVMDLVGDVVAVFSVYQTDKPPACHIEERTKTVTEKVAVCEQTGKEIN